MVLEKPGRTFGKKQYWNWVLSYLHKILRTHRTQVSMESSFQHPKKYKTLFDVISTYYSNPKSFCSHLRTWISTLFCSSLYKPYCLPPFIVNTLLYTGVCLHWLSCVDNWILSSSIISSQNSFLVFPAPSIWARCSPQHKSVFVFLQDCELLEGRDHVLLI